MVNVPTVVWVDEAGRIARPNDVAFTTAKGGRYAQVSTRDQMTLLRRWVGGDLPPKPDEVLRGQAVAASPEGQLARAHFGLGWWLHGHGRMEAAERHFLRGGELAPDDFMIRRGTMRLRGADPFGAEFAEMVGEWLSAGHTYYLPLPVE